MGEYLASIDWGRAVLVAIVAVGVGLAIRWFLVEFTDEVLGLLPFLRNGIVASILRRRPGTVPIAHWICDVCRSINDPTAARCYRGCRDRPEIVEPIPTGVPVEGSGGGRQPRG
jgi:hypothetical protein